MDWCGVCSNAGAVPVSCGDRFTGPSTFQPSPITYHELWVVIKRTRLRIPAAKMSFLRRVAGLSLRDRVRSSDIRRELEVEPLLLCVERSQLRWFWHRTRWRDYISHRAWKHLEISQEESVAGENEAWGALLSRLPPRPGPG